MTHDSSENDTDELLEVVDRSGAVIGTARRSVLHRNPSLIHRVVHVLVFNAAGDLILQKRSMAKDTAPGKWDTSVGGHVAPGESAVEAARREMAEELGITSVELNYLHRYLYTNDRESELVDTFTCTHDGAIAFNAEEISAVKAWSIADIVRQLGTGIFSRHFEAEMRQYLGQA